MVDGLNWTSLTFAISSGKTNIIKILLENGANIHLIDTTGHSPISTAIEYAN